MNLTHLTEVLTQAADRSRVERAFQHADWVVYGAGNAGRAWAAALQSQGKRVHAFMDRNADGRSVDGLPAYPLAACPDSLRQRCAVLLTLHNPGVDVASIRRSVQEAGFSAVWLLQDVIDALPQLAHFWLAPASESLTHVDALTTAYGLLADDASRALFVALLDQRLNGHAEALPLSDPVHQYVPPDLPPPSAAASLYRLRRIYRRHNCQFIQTGLELQSSCSIRAQPGLVSATLRDCRTPSSLPFPLWRLGFNDTIAFHTRRCCQSFRYERHCDGSNRITGSSIAKFRTKFHQDGYRRRRIYGATRCAQHDCNLPPTPGHQRLPQATRPLGFIAANPTMESWLQLPSSRPCLQRLRHRSLRNA